MNLNTLQAFRHGLYECLERGADALFTTTDALLSQPQAQSLAQLSLSPLPETIMYARIIKLSKKDKSKPIAIYRPTPGSSGEV